MARTMPRQKPGKSETVVATPWDFVNAVLLEIGAERFEYDLAADAANSKGRFYINAAADSLRVNWSRLLSPNWWAWLNPPYDDIEPWVRKASQANRNIVVLVPASVGSNWWNTYVHEECAILFPRPRLKFIGHKHPYPKDLAVLVYGGSRHSGYDTWKWR